jgi:hypothetical protein
LSLVVAGFGWYPDLNVVYARATSSRLQYEAAVEFGIGPLPRQCWVDGRQPQSTLVEYNDRTKWLAAAATKPNPLEAGVRCDGVRSSAERDPVTSAASDFEIIAKDGAELCYIIRDELAPDTTTFVTPPHFKQQVGFVAYPAGGEVQRHLHLPLERHLVGTSEALVVRRGRCILDVYDDAKELVASREVKTGDLVLMVGGGHGFRMLEDTLLLEVKQGPYLECDEKERF